MTKQCTCIICESRIEELQATIAAAIYELEERGGIYAAQVLRGQIDYKNTLAAQLAAMTAERDKAAALGDHFSGCWDEEIQEVTKLNAAIPRAYAMGLEAAARKAWAKAMEWDRHAIGVEMRRLETEIRALTPPADLVERVLKTKENENE